MQRSTPLGETAPRLQSAAPSRSRPLTTASRRSRMSNLSTNFRIPPPPRGFFRADLEPRSLPMLRQMRWLSNPSRQLTESRRCSAPSVEVQPLKLRPRPPVPSALSARCTASAGMRMNNAGTSVQSARRIQKKLLDDQLSDGSCEILDAKEQEAQVYNELESFDGRLAAAAASARSRALPSPDGTEHRSLSPGESQAAGVVNREYHLVKMLFRMSLMNCSGANTLLRQIGEEELADRLTAMRERYGARRLNREDFRAELAELLRVDRVSQSESDLLFDMFDSNGSGGVDEDELLHGIRMTQRDNWRFLASYCRRLMDVHTAVGSLITLWEVELLLTGVIEVCSARFPEARAERAEVLAKLTPQSRASQVPIIYFRNFVNETKWLSRALREMSQDAELPPPPEPVTSPTPDGAFKSIFIEHGSKPVLTEGCLRLARRLSAVDKAALEQSIQLQSRTSDRSSRPTTAIDIRHSRFRADLDMRPGQEFEPHPPEFDNPVFFMRDGAVWRCSDKTGPMFVASE